MILEDDNYIYSLEFSEYLINRCINEDKFLFLARDFDNKYTVIQYNNIYDLYIIPLSYDGSDIKEFKEICGVVKNNFNFEDYVDRMIQANDLNKNNIDYIYTEDSKIVH